MLLMKASFIGFLCCSVAFMKLNMRLLSVLISLEGLMLSLLIFFYSSLLVSGMEMHFFLAFLTFAACEAALGLSLLVSLLRLRGNDFVPSFSTLNFYVQSS